VERDLTKSKGLYNYKLLQTQNEAWVQYKRQTIQYVTTYKQYSMHSFHCSEGYLLLISSARVQSLMSCKTFTRVAQVTGCVLPVSHSWSISVFICSASFKCLWAIIFTFAPFLSSRRKVPNWKYFVATSTEMLTTLSSVHVNFSNSGRVGLVPGLYIVCGEVGRSVHLLNTVHDSSAEK